MKKMNKKGFTLAELLIVVAIIAVLVAIAIPVFTAQLEKSREATDEANLRSVYGEAVADYLGASSAWSSKSFTVGSLTFTATASADSSGSAAITITAPSTGMKSSKYQGGTYDGATFGSKASS